jgi:hypothetical protein
VLLYHYSRNKSQKNETVQFTAENAEVAENISAKHRSYGKKNLVYHLVFLAPCRGVARRAKSEASLKFVFLCALSDLGGELSKKLKLK